MDDVGDVRLEQLTAELAWMRRLALALVRDDDAADDISQEAWLAARDRVPGDRPLRPWLSRVVVNVVRMRSRAQSRRVAREAALPESPPVPSSAELVDRVEVQRALADAVLALGEPYRSTVLLHYFEGLSSAEIARRCGIPDGTVRRRLKVALDELRGRFAKRDRRGVLALMPLLSPRTAGGLAMKKMIVGVVALLVALMVIGALVWTRRDRKPVAQKPAASSAAAKGLAVGPAASPTELPWFVQRNVAGRRIAGRVLFQGAPVPGATVRLANETGGRSGEQLAAVKSAPDGAFDFGVQPAALFIVSAEASDKTPAAVTIATADPTAKPESIVLELGACQSRLYGTIVDSSGGGVAKARLTVASLGGTEAGANGEYSLCVPAGDSRVRIVADGYGALELPIHLVGALRRDFELVPESVLAGSVVDETGRGIPFARVLSVPQAVEQPHFLGDGSTTADAEGHFRVTNLAPGRFLLAAMADGYGTSAPKSAVAAPGTSSEITLVVAQRARVAGQVMMKGKPVAGARISVASKQLLVRAAYSQPDGTFVLDGVPLGTAKLLAGSFDVIKPQQLTVAKSIDNLVVEVSEAASLRGTVSRKGKPIGDALVQTSIGPTARSDSAGHYEIHGLPPGELQVTAQAYGSINAFAPFKPVKLAPGGPTEHNIDLSGAAEVQGVVVDESGAVVPNVYVRLIDPKGDLGESMTDAKGAFRCTSMLGGGDYRVAVFPSPGARTAFPPASGDKYDAIKIPDGDAVVRGVKVAIKNERLSIAGRVVDATGSAVADVHVEAIGRGFPGNPAMLPSVRADVSGAFTISDLARGSYALHAHAGDGSEVEVADIPAGTANVELRLVRPGSIEGQLVGFTSVPRVHARQLTAQLTINNEAVIDGDHFSITGLTPGKYVLEALGEEESDGQSVIVRSGAVTKASLKSRGRGSVEGTLTEFGAGTPIKGMACVAAQSMNGQAGDVAPQPVTNNTSDATGVFKIAAPIGKVRVMCFSPDGTFSPAGGDTDVTATAPGKIALQAVRAMPPPSDPGYRIKPLTLPLVIASVDSPGPAKTAGLLPGDRLVSIDGTSVGGLLPAGAMMLAWNHRPGTTLVLGIERNGAPMTIKIVVAAPTN